MANAADVDKFQNTIWCTKECVPGFQQTLPSFVVLFCVIWKLIFSNALLVISRTKTLTNFVYVKFPLIIQACDKRNLLQDHVNKCYKKNEDQWKKLDLWEEYKILSHILPFILFHLSDVLLRPFFIFPFVWICNTYPIPFSTIVI